MRTYTLAALLLLVVAGCGKDPSFMGDDEPPTDGNTTSNPDATPYDPPAGYTRLIGRSWTVPADGKDIYKCARITVPTEMYITDIIAQAPNGTHHTVLSIASGNAAGPDGEQDCSVGTIGRSMLYASGVGTEPFSFPQDVGLKVAAGTQLHLNLHLYNASDDPIGDESAIWVKSQATPPPMLAEMVFAGKVVFYVDPGMQTITGGCSVNQGFKLFAVWPHMHKLATHQKFEVIRNNTSNTLWDAAYDFEEQRYYPPTGAPEFQVQAGDQIKVTCSYDNTTGHRVGFGDSSDNEMCFTGMYRYPSQNASLTQCTELPGGLP
jgi:hypothetical protein